MAQNIKLEMKFIQLFLLLLLSSCGASVVYVKHPVPKMKFNQKAFNSDLIGEYIITDSSLNIGIDLLNELYNPKILFDTDTSVVVTGQLKIIIMNDMIIMKSIYSGYCLKPFYESQRNQRPDEIDKKIDTIIYSGDTVKIISKEEIDTIFNIKQGDIVREYENSFMLNKRNYYGEGYHPVLLTKLQPNHLIFMELNHNELVSYYWSFFTNKMDKKAEKAINNDVIKLNNSELKKLIQNNCFTLRYSIKKIK